MSAKMSDRVSARARRACVGGWRNAAQVAGVVAALVALAALSFYSYPVFHTLTEAFCIIVAISIFIFVLHTRHMLENQYLLFVGVGFLFFAVPGAPHLLGFQGVRLLPGFDNDLPTQAFIVQRFFLATTFLVAPLFLKRRIHLGTTMLVFAAATVLALMSLLVWRNFPHMFIEGSGLTPLKKTAELVLSAMFAASGWLLWRNRRSFDPTVLRMLLAALACFTGSELLFTAYASPFGNSNLLGHLLQVVAFYFTYRAVLVTSIVNPFRLLFREISERDAENARLLEAELSRSTRVQVLRAIAELGVSSLDTRRLAQGLAEALPSVLGAELVMVSTPAATGLGLVPVGSVGWPTEYLLEMTPAPEESPIVTAFESAATTLIGNTQADEVPAIFRARSGRFGARAVAAVPLKVSGEPIGVLSLGWLEPRTFDSDEVSFLEAIAAEAAIGFQNTRLFEGEQAAREQAREELETTRLLLEAAKALAGTIEVREVLATLGEVALKFTGLTRVFVNLIDMEQRVLRPVIASEGLVAPAGSWIPFDRLTTTSLEAILAKRTAILDYERLDTSERDREVAVANRGRLVLFVPLVVGDDIVGHIALDDAGRRHAFSAREIELVESVAAQAAVVVRNARLFDDAQRHAALDHALAEATTFLAESLETEKAMPKVLELTSDALGGMGGTLAVKEPDGWRISAVHGLPADLAGTLHAFEASPALNSVFETRRPVFVQDVNDAGDFVRERAEKMGYRSYLSVPVLYRDQVVAALSIVFGQPREPLNDDELFIVSRIAFTIGVTEENARLYRREHTIAETLQEALLALPDHLAGIRFARLYRSATEASRVGGDFYDVFEMGGGRIGITIGDVAGKGLGAAITTSLVKNTIRAHAAERGKAPSEILRLTHEVVYKATSTETFATVFFGVLDCRNGYLMYSSAGHTTTAIVRADGTVGRLGATGPLLGAFTGANFRQAEARLERDDLLFLYTDGLTEARRGAELYGESRLFDVLASTSGTSPDDTVSRVMDEVMEFADNRLRDDLAILAIVRDEAGAGPCT